MENKKFILIILDGWGIGNGTKSDAIAKGETPYIDSLLKKYPNATLLTSREDVGLPDGQMGNSEVGHMNIGAGRVVYQDLVKINKAIEDNSIAENQTLIKAFNYAKKNDKAVHFIGLISDGGVHSLDSHLYKLCDLTRDHGLDKVYVHAITDGRDTDPRSGLGYIQDLENHLQKSNGTIASLIGRYYTMDRDKRWDRVKEGYDLMIHGKGKHVTSIVKAVKDSYKDGITDEFIKATVKVDEKGIPVTTIKEDDVVICFNYRTDRLREITTVLTQEDMPEEGMQTLNLLYLTMTKYDERFKDINIIYDKENIQNTLGEVISKLGKKQLRIAETEKFAHVTFFMSGGTDNEFIGEKRVLVQSPKVATYDLQPEMSAYEVTEKLVAEIKKQEHDLIVLNFANGDMVGHTGIYEAILKAVKTVDECVEKVVETAKGNGYDALIMADHGNADNAVNQDGSPNTAHSLNPVPSILISDDYSHIEPGILADVAPTILKIMGVEIPKEMTGKVLVKK
ncbi:MAG: 2,3-bisphosphoglycerate-independent phosphoglycerate mutase [Bacteroidetes bacterium]|nr:MAG: 2,3-bisphosphoglycerate-independent phosphoglycerate mutase [Bacteroidota bacterium]